MRHIPFAALEVFVAIAEHGSLRRAAAALGVQPPAISHQLKALEDQLGVSLIARTTRSMGLTDVGRALLGRAKPVLIELCDALESARGTAGARKGQLRVTLPYVAYDVVIAPKLASFHAAYPDIELELSFSEAFVDIVAEGFDAGVRVGDHVQQDMIAVRLTPPFRQAHFAAPAYLDRRGRPARPEDLLEHECIRYRYIGSRRFAEWQFRGHDGVVGVEVKGALIVDSTHALLRAACDGLGIGWLYRPNVESYLHAGKLESVLDDFAIERPGYFLYFPTAHRRSAILHAFVDYMRSPR